MPLPCSTGSRRPPCRCHLLSHLPVPHLALIPAPLLSNRGAPRVPSPPLQPRCTSSSPAAVPLRDLPGRGGRSSRGMAVGRADRCRVHHHFLHRRVYGDYPLHQLCGCLASQRRRRKRG